MSNKKKSLRTAKSPELKKSVQVTINPKFKDIYFTQEEAYYIFRFLKETHGFTNQKIDPSKKNSKKI